MGRHKLTEEQKQASRQKRLQYLKDYQKTHQQDYYKNNKDKIQEYQKEYHDKQKILNKHNKAIAEAIKLYYNDLDNLCKRLQDALNGIKTFEVQEQDANALAMILDITSGMSIEL